MESQNEHCCETQRQKIKRCPFRKYEHGEFMPYYGAECMAYLEYDQPALFLSTQYGLNPPPVHLTLCRRMAQPMYYGGGCA